MGIVEKKREITIMGEIGFRLYRWGGWVHMVVALEGGSPNIEFEILESLL